MSIQLKNVNHGFDVEIYDVGCTIRKGTKWSKIPKNTTVELWECKEPHSGDCTEKTCKKSGSGTIIGNWCGVLRYLPKSLLAMEHNIEARNYDVLKSMLKVGYGEISDDDIITALIYYRVN